MGATSVPRKPRARRGHGAWLRAADDVSVLATGIGYVKVAKGVARRLLREKRDHIQVSYVPELGLLLIDPSPL